MDSKLLKTKTFWGGIATILGAVAGAATGEIDIASAIQMSVTGILSIFIRDGIARELKPQ